MKFLLLFFLRSGRKGGKEKERKTSSIAHEFKTRSSPSGCLNEISLESVGTLLGKNLIREVFSARKEMRDGNAHGEGIGEQFWGRFWRSHVQGGPVGRGRGQLGPVPGAARGEGAKGALTLPSLQPLPRGTPTLGSLGTTQTHGSGIGWFCWGEKADLKPLHKIKMKGEMLQRACG